MTSDVPNVIWNVPNIIWDVPIVIWDVPKVIWNVPKGSIISETLPRKFAKTRKYLRNSPSIFTMKNTKALLTFCLFSFLQSAFCQAPRPKIGVALAGGSALGLAHIGVLAWLEEHQIPVDFISGTSMGGLVAGFYATGQSPQQMRALLKALDWNESLRGEPPFESLPFRRKEDERSVPSRLEIGLKNGFNLPISLNPAQPINMLLSRSALPYSTVTNFDDLPIPFRAMAVDLTKGERVVLKEGSLITALRATMAIPGAFTPVEQNGKVLIDGGLLNNVPTEALKAMGPDVMIAVDLHSGSADATRLKSLIDILGRTQAIAIYDNERRSLALADIVLAPELADVSQLDFSNVDVLFERGYQAAEKKKAILSKLSVSEAQWQHYLDWRTARLRSGTLEADKTQISGVQNEKTLSLERRLQPFVGVDLNAARLAQLETSLTAITGEGRFESFLYELQNEGDKTALVVRANEKKHGPPFVRLGFEVNGADPENLQFNVLSRIVSLDVGKPGAETRTDLRLGSTRQATFEYYRPLGRGKGWFMAPHVFYRGETRQVSQNAARLAIYGEQNVGAGLDFGKQTSRRSELRFGFEGGHQSNSLRTGTPALPVVSGAYSAAKVRWAFDGQDSAVLPTRGTRAVVESQYLFAAPGATSHFPRAEVRLSRYLPVAKIHTAFATFGAGTTFGKTAAPLQQFTLGGPLRLGAYNLDEFRGDKYVLATAGYLHRIGQLPPFLGGKIMAGGWYEFGGAFNNSGPKSYHNNLTAALAAETALGPFFIGDSFGEAGRKRFFFAIGRLF